MGSTFFAVVAFALFCATVSTLAASLDPSAPRAHVKRSYVCPPKFIRQGHRCYFFSKEPEPFQQAMFSCRNMRSNLAVIKTQHQDKAIRSFLARRTLAPHERWLGGVYDWRKRAWKWAASGRPLTYNGFANGTDVEQLSWHCIVMDPSLGYRWNSRSCLEPRHFVCHTKMKTVTGRGKKKLQRQYNADRNNRLNEVPVPQLPEYENNSAALKYNVPQNFILNDQAGVEDGKVKSKRNKKKKKKSRKDKKRFTRFENGTLEIPPSRKTDKAVDFSSIRDIKWRTYRQKNKESPSYPRPIVEEYNFLKI